MKKGSAVEKVADPEKERLVMEKIHVLLMCSSGMSSTIIKANMAKAAEKMGIDLTVDAKAESAVNVERDMNPADIIMLAPQVRYIKSDIEKKSGGKPVEVMSMRDYGLGNGESILKEALKKLGN